MAPDGDIGLGYHPWMDINIGDSLISLSSIIPVRKRDSRRVSIGVESGDLKTTV
jgi:hypothetical protein